MIKVYNRRDFKKINPIAVNSSTAKVFVVDATGGYIGLATMEQALAYAEYLKG